MKVLSNLLKYNGSTFAWIIEFKRVNLLMRVLMNCIDITVLLYVSLLSTHIFL